MKDLGNYSESDNEWNEFNDASLIELEERLSEGLYDIENGRLKKLDNVLARARVFLNKSLINYSLTPFHKPYIFYVWQ